MTITARSSAAAGPERPLVTHDGAGHQHVVEFYETEEFLVGTVAGFAVPALNDGDAVVIVATSAHRTAFEAALRASAVDVDAAVASGRYLALDAAERLDEFMEEGAPDPVRFADMACGLIDRAGAGGRRVRIYGEMVALLWDAGDVDSAIALEDLWNDLAGELDFMLLCAYPMGAFENTASGAAFTRICDQHSTVIPTEGYALLGGEDAQQRGVAQLQQQIAGLRADVARLRGDQILSGLDFIASLPARPGRERGTGGTRTPPATGNRRDDSPGGRLLAESLGTLSSRLRYAD